MKYSLALLAVLTVLSAAPAFAADGAVPEETLSSLGLDGMEIISDTEGTQVRGSSSYAGAMGLSIVSGLLIDPYSKSYVWGSDVNASMSTAENAGLIVITRAASAQISSLAMSLDIASNPVFSGLLFGTAGGSATALAQ